MAFLLYTRQFLPLDYFPSTGLDLFMCSLLARLRPALPPPGIAYAYVYAD